MESITTKDDRLYDGMLGSNLVATQADTALLAHSSPPKTNKLEADLSMANQKIHNLETLVQKLKTKITDPRG